MPAHIRYLKIERFRGIFSLEWRPDSQVNVILGGGNVGKSTLLEAIALLFSPTNSFTLADADYWRREVEEEFLIEAVICLPENVAINQQGAMAWPWEWDGNDAVLPGNEIDRGEAQRLPVYKIRVRGTADLELAYEMIQPDDTCSSFSVALRRSIGLVKLSGDERSDRDLRMVYGAGLDRLIADRGLRARLGREIASDQLELHLDQQARARLEALDTLFGDRALPTELGLAFVGNAGMSVNALVGLTSDKDGVSLPLISWGSGTRRLAALAIADSMQDGHPITVVDELERGLEPYRQRQLTKNLIDGGGQSFVTTHSSTVVSSSDTAALWYIDSTGHIGELPREKVARHQAADPEAFLARLTIVAEGSTELGFLSVLLDKYVGLDWRSHGIHITDATGNDNVLILLEALHSGGLKFAGFADFEGRFAGRWRALRASIGNLLFQWEQGCLEENIIPLIPVENLRLFIEDPTGEKTGMRLRTLSDRLEIASTEFELIADRPVGELTALIVAAAIGQIPERFADAERSVKNPYKGHSAVWFKSVNGGRELAEKVHEFECWGRLQAQMVPFLNAVRTSVGLHPLAEIRQ